MSCLIEHYKDRQGNKERSQGFQGMWYGGSLALSLLHIKKNRGHNGVINQWQLQPNGKHGAHMPICDDTPTKLVFT